MDSLTPKKSSRPKDISSSQASKGQSSGGGWQVSKSKQKGSRKLPKQMQELSSTAKLLRSHLTRKKAISTIESKTPLTASSLHKSNLSHKKKQSLAQEQEEKFRKECTFHPQISAYPLKQSMSFSEKIEFMSTANTRKFELREKTKWNQDLSQETRPKTSGSFAHERLFQDAQTKHNHRDKTLRSVSDSLNTCSFKPRISSYPTPNPKQTLYKRAAQEQKTRAKYKLDLQQQALSKPELTYKPRISEQSKRLASTRRTKSDQIQEPEKEKTFIKSEIKIQAPSSINRRHISTSPSYNFNPTICETSRFMVETSKHRNAETFQDKVNRWSQRKKTNKHETSHFSFCPKIDVISKQLGRSYSTHSHVFKEEQFSFKPETAKNKKFKNVQSNYKQGTNFIQEIKVNNAMREQKLSKIRMNQEYLDIKDCTFQPEVCENRLNIYRYAEVKGKERFMEIREMADKLKKSKSFTARKN